MTPTPTPMLDAGGRRVFVRNHGRFLLVVEGARGWSGKLPGSNVFPADPAQRPDLQLLADRSLGDGSTTVCDTGPAPAGGGVPGIVPPDFRSGQDVTNALRDLSCRFSVHTSALDACTRVAYGDFGFLASGTQKQYCFEVPQTVAFPVGDTVLAAQLKDTSGNLGPATEVVVRVLGP